MGRRKGRAEEKMGLKQEGEKRERGDEEREGGKKVGAVKREGEIEKRKIR